MRTFLKILKERYLKPARFVYIIQLSLIFQCSALTVLQCFYSGSAIDLQNELGVLSLFSLMNILQ